MSIQIDRRDGLSSSTAVKGPCRLATTVNIDLRDLKEIDGVMVAEGDRVLVRAQSDARQNGIYEASTGNWRRTKDFSSNRDVRKGTKVVVTDGLTHATSEWIVSTADPVIIDVSSISFSQIFFSTGSDVTINAPGWITKETLNELNGATPSSEDFGGTVLNDPDPTKNGFYYRQANQWVKGRGLPDTLAQLTVTGGTVNAIEAEVSEGTDPGAVLAFYVFMENANTGNVTIDIGNGPIPVYDIDGASEVLAGKFVGSQMLHNGGTFLQRIDPAAQSASDAADQKAYAEEWAQSDDPISVEAGGDGSTDRSAKYWAGQASEIAVPDGSITAPKLGSVLAARVGALFDTVADLKTDTSLTYSVVAEGDIIEAQGFRYEVAASDATDAHVETAGGVKLYVLRQAGNVLQPEQWGATGDGVADDTAVVQACIDLAESLPNSVVNLLPSGAGYGVSETIEFGLGTYNTVYYGAGQTTGGRNSFTFQKLANVVAWRVNRTAAVPAAQPTLIDISVKGRGNDDPTTNDPLIESTPGALIHHRCVVIRPQFMHVGGMAGLDNEVNTNGYALGIYSLAGTPEGNCNYTVIEDIVASFTNGDVVYIGQGIGAVLNQNAMRVSVRNAYGFADGYVINMDRGFENEFHVLHANEIGLPALGVFRINYIKNYARCVYLEANFHAYGVSFGTDGDNNIVEFLEGVGAADSLYDTIRSNRVADLRRGTEYVGGNSGNTQRGVLGAGGFLAEFMKVGLGWANAVNTALMRVGDVVSTGTGSVGIAIFGTGTSGRSMIRFENANGNVGSISINGSSTTYNTTSDATLKDDDGLISFEQARAVLDLVQFHNFRWKVSGDEAQGVFAQELYEIYPAAVTRGGWRDTETNEWLDEDNGTEYQPWGVDYSKLVTILGACLQGVMVRQDDLETRLAALE